MVEWLQNNWLKVGEVIGYVMLAAGAIVAFFNGPRADRARGILDSILAFLRMIGIGTYKDEPGTVSAPLVPDSKKRIKDIEHVG